MYGNPATGADLRDSQAYTVHQELYPYKFLGYTINCLGCWFRYIQYIYIHDIVYYYSIYLSSPQYNVLSSDELMNGLMNEYINSSVSRAHRRRCCYFLLGRQLTMPGHKGSRPVGKAWPKKQTFFSE